MAGVAFDGSLLGLAVVFVRLGPRMGRVVRRYVLCALCELRGRRDAGGRSSFRVAGVKFVGLIRARYLFAVVWLALL